MLRAVDSLRELSRAEIDRLEIFLDSPYCNTNKQISIIFKEIKKYYPAFSGKNFTIKSLSEKIYSKNKCNDSTFRNLVSDLQTKIEHFLISEEISKDDFDRRTLLLKSLIRKKNNKMFNIHLKEGYKSLEKDGIEGKNYFIKSRLELYTINNRIINSFEKSRKQTENNNDIITQYVTSLICYVITESISSHLKLTVQESKYRIKKNTALTFEMLQALDFSLLSKLIQSVDKKNFIFDLYHNLFIAFQNIGNKQSYYNYRSLVSKHFTKLSKDELSYQYSMLITYCLMHNSTSENKAYYDNELFTIYNIFLKEKLFCDKKSSYLNEDLFRNILVLALRLKKYEWVMLFISDYIEHVHPMKQTNIKNLSLAEYYYHKGTNINSQELLNKAFEHLKEIKVESFIIKYDIKILSLMLYYDLGYIKGLLCQVKNFRQFLWRNNLVPIEKKKKLNKFMNILERLVFFTQGDSKIETDALIVETFKLKNFNYREWLLQKINLAAPKKNRLKQV